MDMHYILTLIYSLPWCVYKAIKYFCAKAPN